MITAIENKYGDTIFKHDPKSERVQSTEASFIISDILSDNTARAPSFGSRLNVPGRDVAVKTGSTDDNRDAWTIGYTPSIAVGVWVGNNENEVMTAGGSAMAGPIWRNSIQAFLADTEQEEFTQPSGVEKVLACTATGSGYEEFFIKGTAPSKSCQVSREPVEEPEEKEVVDRDNDGVVDDKDKCPTVAGTAANDGCPPEEEEEEELADKDGDGVPDKDDECPNRPGTAANDGCPETQTTLDSDNDGVADSLDQCPGTPAGETANSSGCSASQQDAEQQGTGPLVRRRYG